MVARRTCPIVVVAVAAVFVSPVGAQTTTRISVNSAGVQGDRYSVAPAVSTDGRFVAFYGDATNLAPGDTNGWTDVFVRDSQTGQTTRVSVSSAGAQGNHSSYAASISGDGRFVAFYSDATNLVTADTNGWTDVFVRDTQTSQTTRASVDSAGAQGFGYSDSPVLSGDGRFVAFRSSADSLVPGDTNGYSDIFVHDAQTGLTARVSVDSTGHESNDASHAPSISADGQVVAFFSGAGNLVHGDTNGCFDVFVHNMQTGQTARASVNSAGAQANDYSYRASISADGRFVAFYSFASNLVSGDTNDCNDVFVHDMQSGLTTRVSVDSSGGQSDDSSDSPSISADGRFVAFRSHADNLVPGDTNGAADVFVHDTQSGQTARISVDSAGTESNYASYAPAISADARRIAFDSDATNLVTGDSNGAPDVFARDWLNVCYLDADLDGYGAGAPAYYSVTGCGPGFSSNAADCNDALASVHPGAPESCNGIDDDCNGVVDNDNTTAAYCVASLTTHGCTPVMSGLGTASSIQPSGFNVTCSNVEGQRMGLIFYGTTPTLVPWAIGSTSYTCVAPPVQRTAAVNTGGSAASCNGVLTLDFNAYITAHPNAVGSPYAGGQTIYAQAWFRDPSAPKATNLSGGLKFTLCN
jgi:predicted RNA-binding protein with TRAM domain